MITFAELVNRTIIELRQEPGVSVQQYAEDILAAILQRQFNVFFDHYWWPRYLTHGEAMPLNGQDGRVTTDLTNKIKRADDIRYIWYEGDSNPLGVMPPMMNPATASFRKYYATTSDDKIFMIVPPQTAGLVRVTYRTKPAPFLANDEVKMDEDLLICATAFHYLADDEDAPNSIKKFQEATAKREAQLREALNRGPVPFGAEAGSPLTEWMSS